MESVQVTRKATGRSDCNIRRERSLVESPIYLAESFHCSSGKQREFIFDQISKAADAVRAIGVSNNSKGYVCNLK